MSPASPSEQSVPRPMTLPTRGGDWVGWLDERGRAGIARASAVADQVRAVQTSGSPADRSAIALWNDLQLELANTLAVCSLMSQVHPDPEVRTLAEQIELEATALDTDLQLDPTLFEVLASVDRSELDADAARVLDHTLRDFRRAGVDRDATTRDRLRELSEQETALGQEFAKNILDDIHVVEVTTAELAGLPADYVARHPADDSGLHRLTTDYPDAYPFLTFATDADARRRMHVEFLRRGWPANDQILRDLLALRAEHANLLGYPGWPDYDAEVKMIGTGDGVGDFIDRITATAEGPGRHDRDVLLERLRQDQPDAATIDRADATHYAELIRREQFGVDAQQVRTYFDFTRVRDGLLDVTARLFGLTYTPVPDAPTWHDDVAVYDVHDAHGALGRIYLDLHPREGKYKHAAQFTLTRGVLGRQLPEGVLACNVSNGLLEHADVVTLFHEFGHLVHHVLAGRQDWIRLSGVATEWDFVEAPSQLLEEWAWDADLLAGFALDSDGNPIPADLVQRMRAARDFGRAYQARTQMFYAAVSYQLHREVTGDLTDMVRDLQRRYDLFPYVDRTHFHASFGHLNGYTSAYYTYMWSQVIARDLLTGFDASDLMAPAAATRYRDLVLAPGGRKDAADLVEDFLGRPYNVEAFSRWLGGSTVGAGA